MSFASNPERAIIASSLSNLAAALRSTLTTPAASQMWLVIGWKASLTWCGEH